MGKRLDALKASLQALEGTLLYRRGEYEQIIEFYLQDELGTARGKFDRQYGRDRTKAFEYLEQGEQTLQTIVDDWENQEANEEVIRLYRAQLGETRFRLGELLMLHEQFLTASTIQQKTFAYFKIAIDDAESCGYRYLAHDARQSWANALYFADPADSPDNEKRTQRLLLEEQLEQSLQPEQKMFPSVMGKLRITQGDVLFSHYFIRRQKPPLEGREPEEGKDYEYVLRDQAAFDKSTIWKMLRLYVEACDFMAQHGTQDFVAAVRTLQRRIELIAEPAVLDIIAKRLGPAWNFCPNLKEAKQDELDALVQFCQLRNIILDYERPHE